MRRRSELSCSPSLSGDRSGLTGAGGFGDGAGGAGAHPFRCHLLCFHGGGWRRTWRRAGQGGGAGRRRLKSGEVCAQLTAGREGAGKVSLLDFGEVGLKHGDKAVCLLAYNTNWG